MLRPSSLPRIAKCISSYAESAGMPSIGSDAAALGTAWHRVAASLVVWGRDAAERECSRAAVELLVSADQLREWLTDFDFIPTERAIYYPEYKLTGKFGDVKISGTADLVTVFHGGLLEITDYKSGLAEYSDEETWTQLDAYAVMAARTFGATRCRTTLHYARLGAGGWAHRDIDVEETRARLTDIVTKAIEHTELPKNARIYRTGSHCTFCPGRIGCQAYTADITAFGALMATGASPIVTAENALPFWERAGQVAKLADAARDAVKALVRSSGGELASGGKKLRLAMEHRKEYVVKAGEREVMRVVK